MKDYILLFKMHIAYSKVDPSKSQYMIHMLPSLLCMDPGCGGCGHNITGGHHTVTSDRKCHETCHECHVPGGGVGTVNIGFYVLFS